MAKKWIINNDMLVSGNVGYHFELSKNHSTTRGGGYWHIDRENETLYLYSESTDYGRCSLQEVKDVIEKGALPLSLRVLRIVFSQHRELEDAMQDYVVIKEKTSIEEH